MKKTKTIPLADLLDRLQAIMHYRNPQQAFNTLLYGWATKRHFSTARLYYIRKSGHLSAFLAHDFAIYCGYPIDRKT